MPNEILQWAVIAFVFVLLFVIWRLSRRIQSLEATVKELNAKIQARDQEYEARMVANQININHVVAATVSRSLEPYAAEQRRQGELLAQVHDVLASIANKGVS